MTRPAPTCPASPPGSNARAPSLSASSTSRAWWTGRDFVGIEATSVQHQIDHLNGRMYFDHLSKVKRDMLIRKAKKLTG